MKKYVIFNDLDKLVNEYEKIEEAEKALEELENSNDYISFRIEERKVFQIFAQCCNKIHSFLEVDEDAALFETWENAYDYFMEHYSWNVPEEKEKDAADYFDGILDQKIKEEWEKNHILECGDYIFKYCSKSEISRPNMGAELDSSIFEELKKEVEEKYC